jgi:hypothetical protein
VLRLQGPKPKISHAETENPRDENSPHFNRTGKSP